MACLVHCWFNPLFFPFLHQHWVSISSNTDFKGLLWTSVMTSDFHQNLLPNVSWASASSIQLSLQSSFIQKFRKHPIHTIHPKASSKFYLPNLYSQHNKLDQESIVQIISYWKMQLEIVTSHKIWNPICFIQTLFTYLYNMYTSQVK